MVKRIHFYKDRQGNLQAVWEVRPIYSPEKHAGIVAQVVADYHNFSGRIPSIRLVMAVAGLTNYAVRVIYDQFKAADMIKSVGNHNWQPLGNFEKLLRGDV